jgi:hypothetical protein
MAQNLRKMDAINDMLGRIDEGHMRKSLFHIAKDPLPYRKLNYTIPSHQENTLYEADEWIQEELRKSGYDVECEAAGFRPSVSMQRSPRPTHMPHPQRGRHPMWPTIYIRRRSERNILLASISASSDLGHIHPITIFEVEPSIAFLNGSQNPQP